MSVRRSTWRASSGPALAAVAAASLLLLAACGSSNNKAASGPATTSAAAGSSPAAAAPGTTFAVANMAGLGMVVVDGRGHTVYLLTSSGHKNLPCDDASGCTKVWPDLPLPQGAAAATAGSGLQTSLLGTMKLSDGEMYPTYGGWLMYEYTGDSGPAQSHGEGITSFGGTWYAISPSGSPITNRSPPTSAATGGGGSYP